MFAKPSSQHIGFLYCETRLIEKHAFLRIRNDKKATCLVLLQLPQSASQPLPVGKAMVGSELPAFRPRPALLPSKGTMLGYGAGALVL
jgi:hypothetical protein